MENASPVSVHAIDEFRLSDALVRFQGGDRVPLSVFVAEYPRGDGPPLHIHPYAELFLVERGSVKFTAGDEETEISAGNIVVDVVVVGVVQPVAKSKSENKNMYLLFRPFKTANVGVDVINNF